MNKRTLYTGAIIKWGMDAQIKIAMEECVELVKALLKLDRKNNGSTRDDVLEEMADVEIMIEQLKLIFNYRYSNNSVSKFEDIKRQKLERLEKLIGE